MKRKMLLKLIAGAALCAAFFLTGCGQEDGVEVTNQKEDVGVPHHTVEDVMEALEGRGYEIEERLTTDLSDGERARQRRLDGVPAEDWDTLTLGGDILEGVSPGGREVGIYVFDLSKDNMRGYIEDRVEEVKEYRDVFLQVDNLLLELTLYHDPEGLVELLEEEL